MTKMLHQVSARKSQQIGKALLTRGKLASSVQGSGNWSDVHLLKCALSPLVRLGLLWEGYGTDQVYNTKAEPLPLRRLDAQVLVYGQMLWKDS